MRCNGLKCRFLVLESVQFVEAVLQLLNLRIELLHRNPLSVDSSATEVDTVIQDWNVVFSRVLANGEVCRCDKFRTAFNDKIAMHFCPHTPPDSSLGF